MLESLAKSVARAPGHHLNELVPQILVVDRNLCDTCGLCETLTQDGDAVFSMLRGTQGPSRTSHVPLTAEEIKVIRAKCPVGAISVVKDSTHATLGDPTWTPERIFLTRYMAEHGDIPPEFHGRADLTEARPDPHYTGPQFGFARWKLALKRDLSGFDPAKVDLTMPVSDGRLRRKTTLVDGAIFGAHSYGSVGKALLQAYGEMTKLIYALTGGAAQIWMNTGEGGVHESVEKYLPWVIFQNSTGKYGFNEKFFSLLALSLWGETKYGQGAKPGQGGHLLGSKVLKEIAEMRGIIAGIDSIQPGPHMDQYSIEDVKKYVNMLRNALPWDDSTQQSLALLTAKLAAPAHIGLIAYGLMTACGYDFVCIDGHGGGSGAFPKSVADDVGLPLDAALINTRLKFRELEYEGPPSICGGHPGIIGGGRITTPDDALKAHLLGAAIVNRGRAQFVALDCRACKNCAANLGCPYGLATSAPKFQNEYTSDWATQRLLNYEVAYMRRIAELLWMLGETRLVDVIGRYDLIGPRKSQKTLRTILTERGKKVC